MRLEDELNAKAAVSVKASEPQNISVKTPEPE